jgi:hypothetical protein
MNFGRILWRETTKANAEVAEDTGVRGGGEKEKQNAMYAKLKRNVRNDPSGKDR